PRHLLRAGLRARLGWALAADARVTWSGGRFLDDEEAVPAKGGAVLDARLERSAGRLRVRVDGLNLTSRQWEPVGYVLPDLAGGAVPYVLPAPRGAGRPGLELLRGGDMPEKETLERARKDRREGKAPSTQAGEFVHEEIEHVREGKHGARSTKQAIAIGLSKARRAGVELPPPKKGSKKIKEQSKRDLRKGKKGAKKKSTKRS